MSKGALCWAHPALASLLDQRDATSTKASPGHFELGHAIDLHQDTEQGRGHRGTGGRLVPEKLLVHFVELCEPGKVGHVSVHLHDAVQAGSRGLQDRSHVLERLANLVRESIRHIARRGVYGTLARDEHEAVGNHSLGVGTGGSGSSLGHHGTPHRSSYVEVMARQVARSSDPPCSPRGPW